MRPAHRSWRCALGAASLLWGGWAVGSTMRPQTTAEIGAASPRTLVAAIEVDREGARLMAFTLKDRSFAAPTDVPDGEAADAGRGTVQIEVALIGPGGDRIVQRQEIRGLCLEHDPGASPHVQGDTIRLHRESLVIDLPEIAGYDRLEVARHVLGGGALVRSSLGLLRLTSERFVPAGGAVSFDDLAIAASTGIPAPKPSQPPLGAEGSAEAASATLTSGIVHWPEEYGDTEVYRLFGGLDFGKRINIVIVPDGYTYAEKGTMIAHAESLVNAFRARTPYKEHDPFLNYILVFAYATESGTDQCDCSIVKDTPMNTGFPLNTPTCGHSDNRCLFYAGQNGATCDPNFSTENIVAAELRAPARNTTLVMVNTTRYGGCGGSRAVYSAGNSSATEIAIHELGHSLAGLSDEYAYEPSCGFSAGGINTSSDPVVGSWPEWIDDIGPPREGAEYYQQCLYRPIDDCIMRALGFPFCPVCIQQWALTFFSHPNINPSAPIGSQTPASPITTLVGAPIAFNLVTRIALPPATNQFGWYLSGPGFPTPTLVSSTGPGYTRSFALPGIYDLQVELDADTNFIKPLRWGPNIDTASWSVHAQPIPQVSAAAPKLLTMQKNGPNVNIRFEDVGTSHYNVYVSKSPVTAPFAVSSSAAGKKDCAVGGATPAGGGMLQLTGYSLESGLTGPTAVLFVLVTADNGPPTEGPLGTTSASVPRSADSYCGH